VLGADQNDKRENQQEVQGAGIKRVDEKFNQPFPERIDNVARSKPPGFLVALGAIV
jgi:hypothetical protein